MRKAEWRKGIKILNRFSAAIQHVGRQRKTQEDAYVADDVRGLYSCADGLGGHAAGEVASAIAIQSLKDGLTNTPFDLQRTFKAAHAKILADARRNPTRWDMGTTMTAIALQGDHAIVGHVGDSRCYLIRGNQCQQVTKDHNAGAEIEQATSRKADPDWKYALANCLGNRDDSHLGTDIVEIRIQVGDTFVLCTDGLGDYLDGPEGLIDVIHKYVIEPGPKAIAHALLDHALGCGGKDNITAVVVEIRP